MRGITGTPYTTDVRVQVVITTVSTKVETINLALPINSDALRGEVDGEDLRQRAEQFLRDGWYTSDIRHYGVVLDVDTETDETVEVNYVEL